MQRLIAPRRAMSNVPEPFDEAANRLIGAPCIEETKVTVRALGMMLMAGAVLAAPAWASPDQKKEDAPKEKKVCRQSRATGSIIRNMRRCHTAEEWAEIDEKTGNDISDFRDSQRTNSSRSIPVNRNR